MCVSVCVCVNVSLLVLLIVFVSVIRLITGGGCLNLLLLLLFMSFYVDLNTIVYQSAMLQPMTSVVVSVFKKMILN